MPRDVPLVQPNLSPRQAETARHLARALTRDGVDLGRHRGVYGFLLDAIADEAGRLILPAEARPRNAARA